MGIISKQPPSILHSQHRGAMGSLEEILECNFMAEIGPLFTEGLKLNWVRLSSDGNKEVPSLGMLQQDDRNNLSDNLGEWREA